MEDIPTLTIRRGNIKGTDKLYGTDKTTQHGKTIWHG